MTVLLRIDADSFIPPYEQLRRQIVSAIVGGQLAAGTKLAPVRQLARDLSVSPGTVSRAYRELESAGLVTAARGAGTRVTHCRPPQPPVDVPGLVDGFVAAARDAGLTDADILQAVEQRLRDRG